MHSQNIDYSQKSFEAICREGERLIATHCSFCGMQCGMNIRVEQETNRVVGVEPRYDFPMNGGRLCPKGVSAYRQAEHEERLLKPLIRKNGRLTEASWDEAMELVASRIKDIQAKYGKDAMAIYSGSSMTNEKCYLMGKFARIGLGTKHIDYNGRYCMSAAATGFNQSVGIDRGSTNPWSDIKFADVLLIAGSNTAECHPLSMPYIWGARDRGAKLIVVDPRETKTALVADYHLNVRPGTDIALVNGLIHILIKENLVNTEFVEKHTNGFEELRALAERYTPEETERITGVSRDRIIGAARAFGQASNGMGVDESEIPGPGISAYELLKSLGGDIKGLLLVCSNPMVSAPSIGDVERHLRSLDFFVAIDMLMSESAELADVVLPSTVWIEDNGTTTNVEGRVIRLRGIDRTPGESRRDWEIVCDLAERLGRGRYFKYGSSEEIFNELRVASAGGIADYSGITYEKIDKMDGVFWPCPSEDHPGTPRLFEDLKFHFPDGKAQLHAFEHAGPNEKVSDEYPFILTTGRVVYHYLSGNQTRRIEALRKLCPDPYVEIHPQTAEWLNIGNGEQIVISSRRGSITVPAKITKTIRRDSLFVPYHWGKSLGINNLTNPALDPKSKIPEFKVCAVKIEKAGEAKGGANHGQSAVH